jgi:quercetin dioxygenase-like cupin family protein
MNTTSPTPTQTPVELHAGAALLQWYATSEDTDGAYALAHATIAPGGEPPLHVHAREDETFYLLSGTMTFQRGMERIDASAGDTVHLPRGIQHGFKVTSSQARVLLVITPGGIEQAFRATSVPTDARPATTRPRRPARRHPRTSTRSWPPTARRASSSPARRSTDWAPRYAASAGRIPWVQTASPSGHTSV